MLKKNYSAFDKELLAVYLAVKHFRHYLEGRVFTVYTDHKPLVGAIANNTDRSPRQSRHLSFVSEFTTNLRHLPGRQNTVADALSCLDISAVSVPTPAVVVPTLAAAQLAQGSDMSLGTLRLAPVSVGPHIIWCDDSVDPPRPWVPPSLRRRVFLQLHGVHHPGTRTTIRDVSARYVWFGMRSDLHLWTRQCESCQRAKISRHVHSPFQRRPVPDRRFGSLHVEFNGMVERFHRTLKERLMARQAGPHWMDHLAPVLMGLRASVREDSMTSPAELVFGAPFRLPGVLFDAGFPQATDLDDFVKTLRDNLSMVVPHPVNYNVKSTGSLPHSLWTAKMVFLWVNAVRRPLEPPYEGPF